MSVPFVALEPAVLPPVVLYHLLAVASSEGALVVFSCSCAGLKASHSPLQGFDQEGIDDLVSGILMGSYHSGGGGGPLVGGAAKHLLGFPWSGALFAAILAVQGVVIAILAGVMPPEPKYEDEAPGKLAPITGAPFPPGISDN